MSTIAELIGMKSPVANEPLIKNINGNIIPMVGAKNVRYEE